MTLYFIYIIFWGNRWRPSLVYNMYIYNRSSELVYRIIYYILQDILVYNIFIDSMYILYSKSKDLVYITCYILQAWFIMCIYTTGLGNLYIIYIIFCSAWFIMYIIVYVNSRYLILPYTFTTSLLTLYFIYIIF